MVPPQPRLTSPPLGVVGGKGAPEALPSLLPPPQGGPLQFVVTALHVIKKKKKFAECPTLKKKKSETERKKPASGPGGWDY